MGTNHPRRKVVLRMQRDTAFEILKKQKKPTFFNDVYVCICLDVSV